MVLVNNGGGSRSYAQLEHSAWDGWTLTDVVFPSFLWIVGVAITLSLGKRLQAGARPATLLPPVFRRAAVLYLIGVFLYLLPDFDFSHARILGVLQRIAICYLVVSCLYLFTGVRGQIAVIAGLLLVYTALMMFAPVPGYGAGHLDTERNFAHYVDRIVLGQHNYASTKTWDPEGIVSSLPAIATTLFGVLVGHVLRLNAELKKRIGWLILLGVALIAAGQVWNIWMPINKKLWSCSFSLFMAGFDCVLLSIFLWFIDGLGYKKAVKPFVIVGMNSIAVYVASEILPGIFDWINVRSDVGETVSLHDLIYSRYYAHVGSVESASLLWALTVVAAMYLIAYGLYKKSWFWKV